MTRLPSSTSLRWPAAVVALSLLLPGCESSLNRLRTQRFDATPLVATTVAPRALALALRLSADGGALAPDSLHQANALLTRQGRIDAQVLTITPFNARGAQFATRLAQALQRTGAATPRIQPVPTDPQRLAQAGASGWDLELQSDALVANLDRCEIADTEQWAVHPYRGVGTLGCATRNNIARMTRDPRDLTRPRTLDGGDGRAAAAAVQRYQNDQLKDLIDIDFDED